MPRTIWMLVAVVLLGTACGGGNGEPATQTAVAETSTAAQENGLTGTGAEETEPSTGASETAARSWTECRNDVFGYVVRYPEGWYTTELREEDRCRWFDRQPFELEAGTEAPLTDLVVRATDGTFEQAVEHLHDPFGARTLSREAGEENGRRVVRFETELTEDLLYPAGTTTYGYVVDRHGTALWIETRSPPDRDVPYAENRDVVDHVAATLELDEP